MTLENISKENGKISYDGKTYVLLQPAYIEGSNEAPYYTASAICPEEGVDEDDLYNVYTVTWAPLQDWLDGDREDEGWACDWDHPETVEKSSSGYNLADGRII